MQCMVNRRKSTLLSYKCFYWYLYWHIWMLLQLIRTKENIKLLFFVYVQYVCCFTCAFCIPIVFYICCIIGTHFLKFFTFYYFQQFSHIPQNCSHYIIIFLFLVFSILLFSVLVKTKTMEWIHSASM